MADGGFSSSSIVMRLPFTYIFSRLSSLGEWTERGNSMGLILEARSPVPILYKICRSCSGTLSCTFFLGSGVPG